MMRLKLKLRIKKKIICFETGLLTEKMSLGRQRHQLLSHHREHPLIPGHVLVSAGNLHLLKRINLDLICDSINAVLCFSPHSVRYLNIDFAYWIYLHMVWKIKLFSAFLLEENIHWCVKIIRPNLVIEKGKEKKNLRTPLSPSFDDEFAIFLFNWNLIVLL